MKAISVVMIFVIAMLAIATMYGAVSGGFENADKALFGDPENEDSGGFSDDVVNPEGNDWTSYRFEEKEMIYSG